jgi:carbamoyl-phosphate synthase large subunit
VTKVPRWPADKFPETDFTLSTAMKSTGEAMSIGRTFEESLLKALRSSEYDPAVDWTAVDDDELAEEYLIRPSPDRPYAMLEAFVRGFDVDEVTDLTGIEGWYVERFAKIAEAAIDAAEGDYTAAASVGFTDNEIAAIAGGEFHDTHASWLPASEPAVTDDPAPAAADGGETVPATPQQVASDTPDRSFKQVDTCAGEFEASTPYYYSARRPELFDDAGAHNELQVDTDVESVVVVGGGPIRIGQGVEFDYCAVHAVRALEALGIDAHVVNNNPETVSTDYDTSDGLFFEPITAEEVADAIEATDADGVMVQFGGQTSVDVGEPLEAELERRGLDCEILGTAVDAMDLAEDRDRFNRLMTERGIEQPAGGSATSEAEALDLAHEIGYPVLVRPSYVLGGRAMDVVHDDDDLREYVEEAVRVSPEKPILIDSFLENAVELDVDAVSDGEDVLIGGVMEHVESAGVHSGDSACVIPPRSLDDGTLARVREVVEEISEALSTVGLLNVQLAVQDGDVYVLEANPRSSRTVPFVSKATGVPIAKLAARAMAGESLSEMEVTEQIPEQPSVKEVVLPFDRLPNSDPRLGPEMKSTGEVMGTAGSFGAAYGKAQIAADNEIPESGTLAVDGEWPEDVLDEFAEHLDRLETDDLESALMAGEIDFLLSTERESLTTAVEEEVPYLSTEASARAALEALDVATETDGSLAGVDVAALSDRPTREEHWG